MTAGNQTLGRGADASIDGMLRSCAEVLQPMVRIGVTGHRDLTDPDGARGAVTEALCAVLAVLESAQRRRRFLIIRGTPRPALGYQIVSPLAEGADRIVGELVLSDDPRLLTRPRPLASRGDWALSRCRPTLLRPTRAGW